MQSRFKFRVWDTEKNEWLGTSEPDIIPYNGFHLFGECMLFQNVNIRALSKCIIGQYTGLNDQNNNPIYEGDVLGFFLYEDSDPELYVIEWDRFGFFGRFSRFKKCEAQNILDRSVDGTLKDFIIVGNIYENPTILQPHY